MLGFPSFQVSPASEGQCVVALDNGRYFKVPAAMVPILDAMRDTDTVPQAHERYSAARHNAPLSYEVFAAVAESALARMGRDAGDAKSGYLSYRLGVLQPNRLDAIIGPLGVLFSTKVFVALFLVALTVIVGGLVLLTDSLPAAQQLTASPVLTFAMVVLSSLLHELGHLAACRRHGARHGGIGVGLYLIFPVFYSDVTGLWMLNKWLRCLANLSGVYMEMLLVCVLLLGAIWQPAALAPAIFIILARIAYTLLPFFRSDGYWVASDLLAIPDLLHASSRKMRDLVGALWDRDRRVHVDTKKDRILLVYGVSNMIYMPIIIALTVKSYGDSLLALPLQLGAFIESVVRLEPAITMFTMQSIGALFFYLMLGLYLSKLFRSAREIVERRGRAAGTTTPVNRA